jgi:hypothetical protein
MNACSLRDGGVSSPNVERSGLQTLDKALDLSQPSLQLGVGDSTCL